VPAFEGDLTSSSTLPVTDRASSSLLTRAPITSTATGERRQDGNNVNLVELFGSQGIICTRNLSLGFDASLLLAPRISAQSNTLISDDEVLKEYLLTSVGVVEGFI